MSDQNETFHLLKTVLESMSEGFIAWSSDYKLVEWNQQFLDYWGYPKGLMRKGLPLLDLMEYQASLGTYGEGDPRKIAERVVAGYILDLEKTAAGDTSDRIVKSYSGHWLRMRRRLVDGFGFVTWASDITESYAAEKAADLMHNNIDSFSDSILMSDADGRMTFTNHRYHEIYPTAPPKEEIPNYTQEQLIRLTLESGRIEHPLAISNPEAWVQERLEERRRPGTTILETRHSNGRIYQIKQQHDPVSGSIVITSDITERVKAEEALQEAKANLEARVKERTLELQEEIKQREIASNAKSDFLANMSHELRTPLNAVIGFSDIMLKEVQGPLGSPKYVEYAKAINQAGGHLLGLINDVLDLSKVEAGYRELSEKELDPLNLVCWAERMLKEQAEAKGLEIISELTPENTPDIIYADERALRQIVLNLLSNAVKFTENGGKITLSSHIDDLGFMVFSITDNGRGISPDQLEKVMEPFSQAAPTDTRDHEGTGLGLPLVKKLVELHDGRFQLSSVLGEGTTATVFLPPGRCINL